MDPKGCYMMAAGRKATADGSVMVARSCDSTGGDDVVQIIAIPRRSHRPEETITIPEAGGTRIPQVEETYAYIAPDHLYHYSTRVQLWS